MFPHKVQQVLMKLIFPIIYYWLIGKLRIFARLSQIIHQKHKIIKESDVQNNKIGGFLNRTFGKLIHVALPLRKNLLMSLVKSVLIGLGWTATISATDAGILGCGTTTLTILNLKDIKKIVKSLEDADVLIKNLSQTIEKETKKQKGKFLKYAVRYFGCYCPRKCMVRQNSNPCWWWSKLTIEWKKDFWSCLILWLTSRCKDIFKINLDSKTFIHKKSVDECKSIRIQWIALYANGNNVAYFDSLVLNAFPKILKDFW